MIKMDNQSMRRGAYYGNRRMGGRPAAAYRSTSVAPECGCADGGLLCLDGERSLAMVYAPCQSFGDIYDIDTGFSKGTIFRELYKPFMPACGREG